MSLDVYLYRQANNESDLYNVYDGHEYLFEANITNNLGKMAAYVGIYEALWEPNTVNIIKAGQLILPLGLALSRLELEPDYYKQFQAKNNWGLYIHFVPWLRQYLEACNNYPEALISVSH